MRQAPIRVAAIAAAILVLAIPLASAGEPPPVGPGDSRRETLAAGERRLLPLAAASGDYVWGRLALESGRAGLDLVTCTGGHLRRLAGDAAGERDFRLMVPEDRPCLALQAGADPAVLDLTILRRIPPGEQVASPDYLSPTMAALAKNLSEGGTSEAFWAAREREGTPLVEPGSRPDTRIVTFLQRGAKRNVRLFGAPSNDHDRLERLGSSDVWFRSYELPASTRLAYKLAPDVPDLPGSARERRVAILATAQADPLNRHPWPAAAPDPFAQESTLTLPDAPQQPGLDAARDVPQGTKQTFRFQSGKLGNTRQIVIYQPARFDPQAPDAVLLIVFDGPEYRTRVPTPAMLDNLIAQGRLPPVMAVFVDPIDSETRGRELPGNAAFADAMADELLPRIAAETGLRSSPGRTVLAGSSYGGLAAVTIAARRPDAFGNAISLSGSFWWHPPGSDPSSPNQVAAELARAPQRPLRFFISAGLFERGGRNGDGILETSRHLRDVLIARGYDVTYRDYAGGHDYLVWRGALADGLIALLGRP